jgi:hypothetical protein
MPLDADSIRFDAPKINEIAKVKRDRADLRDLRYQPTLNPLRAEQKVPQVLLNHPELVRNQNILRPGSKHRGTCTAHALAAVIDILRSNEGKAQTRVSAEMIYRHGKEIEAQESGRPFNPDANEGLWSLRSAIKAFYNNGVCLEDTWIEPDGGSQADELKIVKAYKEACNVPLGSYYRLQPILNDFHAALNEVDVIYAAAEIHGGWDTELVKQNGGRIVYSEDTAGNIDGNHAFAIVGYTKQGFLVMNSWGADWGGTRVTGHSKPIKGVALWPYQDWAERLIDGWVLRLGVSAPDAFQYSFGRRGVGDLVNAEIASGSTPRHELMGHYLHMDDGEFVNRGAIPSSLESLSVTCRCIKEKTIPIKKEDGKRGTKRRYDKLLVWITGSSEGTKETLRHISSTKEIWKQRGVYPLTVLWCSDLLDQASTLLWQLAQGAMSVIGHVGTDLDVRIERDTRAIGKAVWRDIRESAERACEEDLGGDDKEGGGAMNQAFKELMLLPENVEIHLVAEGGGAILAHELLGEISEPERERIASLTLVMPACSVKDLKEIHWRLEEKPGRLRLLLASKEAHKRMRLGDYGGSIIDLVQWSFVEKPPVRGQTGAQESKEEAFKMEEDALAKVEPKSRIVGVMDAETLRGVLQRCHDPSTDSAEAEKYEGLDIRELSGPKGLEVIKDFRAISAGAEARTEIQGILFGKAPSVPQPEVAQYTRMRPQDAAALARMMNKFQMPAI